MPYHDKKKLYPVDKYAQFNYTINLKLCNIVIAIHTLIKVENIG